MIYLTTGIIDQYDNPKVHLECAITKAYSQDLLRRITEFALNLIDAPSTVFEHSIGLNIRDALQLQYNETSSALKTYVGKIGLQHAAVNTFHYINCVRELIQMSCRFENKILFAQSIVGSFWKSR